ncbi:MAG: LysR family transcriptional regulator [Alcaligenaceae bacterium]|nr:LysR family transcriptional regulator [Alcaligenaceae bacterium]
MIDLVQLRTFVCVAEEQHLTRAAERLHISQSAASAHVRAIEDHFDTQLFIRTNRNLKLTHAGERLLDEARTLLNNASVFTSFARKLRGKMEGQLVIGTSSDPSSRAADTVAALLTAHPLISVDLRARPSAGTRQDLKTGELDAGILLGPSNDSDINHYELTHFGFRIVGPIALKEQIESADWEALAGLPWITPLDTSMAYSALLDDMFTSRGLTPRSVARFDNASLARAMSKAGVGLTLMREDHAHEDAEADLLAISPIAHAQLPLYVVHLASRKSDPLIEAFVAAALSVWPDAPSAPSKDHTP